MILVGMPDTLEPLPSDFFVSPRCPPSASFDPPAATAVREEPLASSPLAAVDGIDTQTEPSDGAGDESNVAASG